MNAVDIQILGFIVCRTWSNPKLERECAIKCFEFHCLNTFTILKRASASCHIEAVVVACIFCPMLEAYEYVDFVEYAHHQW